MTKKEFQVQLAKRMNASDLLISPNEIKFEDRFCRCGTKAKPRSKNGSYRIFTIRLKDKIIYVAWWRDWSTFIDGSYSSVSTDEMTPKFRKAYQQAYRDYSQELEQEAVKRRKKGLKKSQKVWAKGKECVGDAHGYLKLKKVSSYGLKLSQAGVELWIPMYNEEGELQNIQQIYKFDDEYVKRFLPYPIGGCFYSIPPDSGKEQDAILLAEGYATAKSLQEATGLETWVAFYAANLEEVAQIIRRKYKDRKIVICADYDKPNKTYTEPGGTGLVMATKAMQKIGNCYLAVPPHPDDEKIDFNDLFCKQGLKSVSKVISDLLKGDPQNVTPLPEGYKIIKLGEKEGLYRQQAGEDIFLGRPIEVIAEACNSDSTGWAKQVKFKDKADIEHKVLIPFSELDRNWLAILADNGWICEAKPAFVQEFLKKSNPQFRNQYVEQIGWQQEKNFVFPDIVYGEPNDISYFVDIKEATQYFTYHGVLKDWQKIAKLCRGNPFMKFGVATAFVGPILPLVKMDNIGFIFEGLTSIGKTTILRFAASVYGNPQNYINTWRATDNAMEDLAYLYNNTLFVIDELSMSNPDLLGSTIYMLGNGQGKARADQYGVAKKIKKWNEAFLCSGEVGVSAILEEAGKRKLGGQEVRMCGFYLSSDHIKNLHNFDDTNDFLAHINRSCLESYGLAGRDFISKLVTHGDLIKLSKELLASIDKITAYLCPSNADAQITRVAKNMALVACAGELAANLGTLPKTFTKLGYVKTCFANWLANRKLEIRCTEDDIIRQIRNTLKCNRTKHFQDISRNQDLTGELWGYTGVANSGCKESDYIMPRETFERLFCKGYNTKQVVNILKRRGMLRFDIDADGTQRTTKKVTFGEFKQKRMIVIDLEE